MFGLRALTKLDNILKYLAFAIKVHHFVDILKDFPELGTIQHSEKNVRGFVIVKQVTIFYKIDQDQIRILNLFDNRQHPKKK